MNFTYGPLVKSVFTQELELFAKCLLAQPDKIQLDYKNHGQKNTLHGIVGNLEINLSGLFKKADFSHIQLDQIDSEYYTNIMVRNDVIDNVPDKYKELTNAEVNAIRAYTGAAYSNMNDILYGNKLYTYHDATAQVSVFLRTMMVASGLNKIESETSLDVPTYRGEKLPLAQLEERKHLIDEGGDITDSTAFWSTSTKFNIACDFAMGSIVHLDAPYGKDIKDISYVPHEDELLLTPSPIYWTSYEKIDGIYHFYGKVVAALETQAESTAEDIEAFQQLLNWATEQGINTDFITPDLRAKLNTTPLTLADCIQDNNEIIGLEPQQNTTAALVMPQDVAPLVHSISLMVPEMPVFALEMV